MIKDKVLVRCVVNGKEVAEYVDPRESLLDMLRNRLGLTSVKKGCEVGECGACTVIIDGETIDSCIYLAVWAGEKISVPWKVWKRTGILPVFRRLLLRREQSSAVLHTGLCYVCNGASGAGRGTYKRSYQKHMSGNLCRCTGYQNIVNAVEKSNA